jgi:putative thioredoxin
MTSISPLESPYIIEGTRDNFTSLVLENSEQGPVLVNYWSPRAGPCLRLYPVLDKLIHDLEGKLLLVNLNTDELSSLAREYGVTSLPTLKLFRHREVVETRHGYQNEAELRRMLNQYIAQPSDRVINEALALYHEGETEHALTRLAEAATADPQNTRLPLTLTKLLMREQRFDQAYQLLKSRPRDTREAPEIRDLLVHLGFIIAVREAPDRAQLERKIASETDNLEARYQLSALKLIDDDYEGAMALLLEIMRKDSGFREGVGRKGLLAIFNILSNQGELVDRYRKLMVQYAH